MPRVEKYSGLTVWSHAEGSCPSSGLGLPSMVYVLSGFDRPRGRLDMAATPWLPATRSSDSRRSFS